jgi:hypothetical protein
VVITTRSDSIYYEGSDCFNGGEAASCCGGHDAEECENCFSTNEGTCGLDVRTWDGNIKKYD